MDTGFWDEWKLRGMIERAEEEEHLKQALAAKPQRIKFGIDPTAAELHLGHSVIFRILKKLQDAGHTIVLIIGDFTAQIGDPSGRSETRRVLTEAEIGANKKNYLRQIGKLVNVKKAEIRHNSEWYKKSGAKLLLELMSQVSVGQVLERQDFKHRMEKGQEVTMQEALYPVLQGYDSVAVDADIEIGGSDQEFNLLMGRRIQRKFGKKEQDILTTKLLVGTDGVRKMSKSFGNSIGIEEKPEEMFGKIMSVSDATMLDFYFPLLTDIPVEAYTSSVEASPRDAKMLLAREIVTQYHGEMRAKKAEAQFVKAFVKKDTGDARVVTLSGHPTILGAVAQSGGMGARSRSEARRLIEQGAVDFDGVTIRDTNFKIERSGILRVGKKTFVKLEIQ